jgi:hypothetical protein
MRDCGSLSAIAAHGPEPVEWARQDSNLGPTDYESAALTAELRALREQAYRRHKEGARGGTMGSPTLNGL